MFLLSFGMSVSKSLRKKANNYAHFVDMTLKIVKFHMSLTYSKMSNGRFRYVPLIEHIELFYSTKKTEEP